MELKLEELCFTVLPDLRPLGTFIGFKDTRLEVQRTLTLHDPAKSVRSSRWWKFDFCIWRWKFDIWFYLLLPKLSHVSGYQDNFWSLTGTALRPMKCTPPKTILIGRATRISGPAYLRGGILTSTKDSEIPASESGNNTRDAKKTWNDWKHWRKLRNAEMLRVCFATMQPVKKPLPGTILYLPPGHLVRCIETGQMQMIPTGSNWVSHNIHRLQGKGHGHG